MSVANSSPKTDSIVELNDIETRAVSGGCCSQDDQNINVTVDGEVYTFSERSQQERKPLAANNT